MPVLCYPIQTCSLT